MSLENIEVWGRSVCPASPDRYIRRMKTERIFRNFFKFSTFSCVVVFVVVGVAVVHAETGN